MSLSGGKLAGGNPKDGRVEDDFYATNPKAVKMLLEKYEIKGSSILEPCCGQGHIISGVKGFYPKRTFNITVMDIKDRGFPNTKIQDFLAYNTDEKFDCIITNPPYSLAKEFVEKGLEMLSDNGQMMMFLKIQFLESSKRKLLFEKYPPKYIYVFSDRMATWNNGNEFDDNGKRWATTMCHAWFVWEKNSTSEPIVRWL